MLHPGVGTSVYVDGVLYGSPKRAQEFLDIWPENAGYVSARDMMKLTGLDRRVIWNLFIRLTALSFFTKVQFKNASPKMCTYWIRTSLPKPTKYVFMYYQRLREPEITNIESEIPTVVFTDDTFAKDKTATEQFIHPIK